MALSATLGTLALMIGLQSPGMSPYSRIAVDTCDEDCQKTPLCDEPVLWCRPPHWSGKHQSYMRYENFEEGVHRYLRIADVIRQSADTMVWQTHDKCAPPGTEDPDDGEACDNLRRERPFTGTRRALRLFLTTVTYYESTYRRDVHAGTTRGDCDYTEIDGRKVLIAGSCRSHCMGQVKVEGKERTRRGLRGDQLVGLSRKATARCLTAVTDRLSSARNACVANRRPNESAHPACVFGVYGGVHDWRSDKRIQKRHKTYLELARTKPKLSKRVRTVLGLDDE